MLRNPVDQYYKHMNGTQVFPYPPAGLGPEGITAAETNINVGIILKGVGKGSEKGLKLLRQFVTLYHRSVADRLSK